MLKAKSEAPSTWRWALLAVLLLAAFVWDVLLDVGRMGFFWGWWGR